MTEVLFTSIAFKLLTAVLALAMIWLLFRTFDRNMGHPFCEAVEKMYENPMALAVYYGLRFVGGCILVGLLLS